MPPPFLRRSHVRHAKLDTSLSLRHRVAEPVPLASSPTRPVPLCVVSARLERFHLQQPLLRVLTAKRARSRVKLVHQSAVNVVLANTLVRRHQSAAAANLGHGLLLVPALARVAGLASSLPTLGHQHQSVKTVNWESLLGLAA